MTLAQRAASAKAEDTAGLLGELWKAAHGMSPAGSIYDCGTSGSRPGHPDRRRAENLNALRSLDTPESLLAAALMLVPNGWHFCMTTSDEGTTCDVFQQGVINRSRGFAPTPALALIAAIAQAKEL